MKRNKVEKLLNYLLIVVIFSSLFLFFGIFIRGQKTRSVLEGRNLNKYKHFTLKTFLNGEYQKNVEDTLIDQLIFSGNIKSNYYKLESKLINNILISNSEEKEKLVYIQVKDDVYKFRENEHLFNKYNDFLDNKEYLDGTINNFNSSINDLNIPTYLYYISSSRSKNLTNDDKDIFYDYIKDNINIKSDIFEIKNYDEYKKYFYINDHHWNHLGQYKGYTEIMKLLGFNNVINPSKEVTYDVNFYGSYSRITLDDESYSKFTVYKYDVPKYITYINGKKKEYGNKKSYDNGTYSKNKYDNRYASYYGTDYKEVIYDFNNNKDNLLLIGTSYSNSINDLIAMNYNKTYVVDLRHYDNFNLKEYVSKNKIDTILIMGDIYSFIDNAPRMGD